MRDTEGAGEREELQADLRATIGSVPDHHNKANIMIKMSHTKFLVSQYI